VNENNLLFGFKREARTCELVGGARDDLLDGRVVGYYDIQMGKGKHEGI